MRFAMAYLSVSLLFAATALPNQVCAQQSTSASQTSPGDTVNQAQSDIHPNYQDMLKWREGLMAGMETIRYFDQNGHPISARQFDDGVVKGRQALNVEIDQGDKTVVLRLLSAAQLAKIKKDKQALPARPAG